MPFWDSPRSISDQQLLEYVDANISQATASTEADFRANPWAEVREVGEYLVGLSADPDWPGSNRPAGLYSIAGAAAFIQ